MRMPADAYECLMRTLKLPSISMTMADVLWTVSKNNAEVLYPDACIFLDCHPLK